MKLLIAALTLCAAATVAEAKPVTLFYANWSDHTIVSLEVYKIKANGKKAAKPLWVSTRDLPGHIEPIIELPAGYRCGTVEVAAKFDDGQSLSTQADLCTSTNVHISYYP